jgi:hypothetical protein
MTRQEDYITSLITSENTVPVKVAEDDAYLPVPAYRIMIRSLPAYRFIQYNEIRCKQPAGK